MGAGLLAALFLAITPISVVTGRNNTIDSLLVLTVLLGAYAITRAAENGSLRWLLLAAILVGLGFNIKMLEAYLAVPAFAAIYLLAAPLGWWSRLWRLALAGVVMVALSLAWVISVDLMPASARPYVGSSGTNSELDLALGYNGIERLLGMVFGRGGASTSGSLLSGVANATSAGGPGGASENGAAGVFRLLNTQLGGQVSWLLALGVVGLLASGWGIRWNGQSLVAHVRSWAHSAAARRTAHLTAAQGALALWGGWTLTMAAFFSVAGFFHTYYLSMLAPGIAALAGIGLVLLWRDYRNPLSGWRGWLLPIALVGTALVQGIILADYSGWNTWMTPLIVTGSLLVAGLLVWSRVVGNTEAGDGARRMFRVIPVAGLAAALGVALLLVGPATWVGVSLANGAGGGLPTAGPSATLAQRGGPGSNPGSGNGPQGGGGFPRGFRGSDPPAFGGPGGGIGFGGPGANGANGANQANGDPANGGGQALQVNQQLLAYLEAHRGSATYLFATSSSQTAAPYIIVSGQPVMALGGFNGSDQILSLSQLQALVRAGTVRYFLLDGGGFGGLSGGGGGAGGGNAQLTQWVTSSCAQVSTSDYGGSGAGGSLYDCASAG